MTIRKALWILSVFAIAVAVLILMVWLMYFMAGTMSYHDKGGE